MKLDSSAKLGNQKVLAAIGIRWVTPAPVGREHQVRLAPPTPILILILIHYQFTRHLNFGSAPFAFPLPTWLIKLHGQVV